MKDLASLGLKVRVASPNNPGEQRIELRLASTDAFIAWFQTNTRVSAGEEVESMNTQVVHRSELSGEQITAAKAWLREQVLATV